MRNLKKILALVLALVMSFSVMSVAGAYEDQEAVDASAYKTALEVLSAIKVLEGDTEGNLNPEKTITRGEVAAIIYRIHSGDVDKAFVDFYKDANIFEDADWSAAYVNYCAMNNIVKGRTATIFDPKAEIIGYDVLAMIMRAIGYDAKGEFTGNGYKTRVAIQAQQLGLLNNLKGVNLDAPATRALVSELVFRTMAVEKVAHNGTTYVKLGETLNKDFALTAADSTVVNRDEWGVAYTESGWYMGNEWIEATYSKNFDEKLASFNTTVTAADVLKINEKLTGDFAIYVDGKEDMADVFAVAKDSKDTVGGQGITVDLYKGYVVVTKTHLVEITKVDTKKGETTINLDGEAVETVVKTTAYEKGAYLLVKMNKNGIDWKNAQAVTSEKIVFNRIANGEFFVEGKEVAMYAEYLNLTGATLAKNTEYSAIKDEAGNIVAVLTYKAPAAPEEEAPAPVYVVVLGAQEMTGNVGFGNTTANYEVKANVLYLGETEYKTVNLAGYYNGLNDKKEIQVVPFDKDHGFEVKTTYSTDMYGDLYEVVATDKNGALILNAVETEVDTTPNAEGKDYAVYTKGDYNMIKDELVNNKTIFAFLDATKGTATYVTGYNNIATFNAKAEDVLYTVDEETGFVTNVYVTATVVVEAPKPADVYVTTDAYYYLTSEAEVDWNTLTLSGLVDMNGEAVTLNVEKTFAADIYNTLTEMIDLYAGTILKVTVTTKNGEVYNTEIASAMAAGATYNIKDKDGKVVKTMTAQYMAKDSYELVDGLLIVKAAKAQQVLDLNSIKNIVDQDGNKVDVAELYDLTGNLYVVYDELTNTVETIVVTVVTAEKLAERLDASLEKITAEAILADVDSKLLTYTVGSDVEAYTAKLVNAILNSTALEVVAMSGNVVAVKVEINVEELTGKAIVTIEGVEAPIEIALTIKE